MTYLLSPIALLQNAPVLISLHASDGRILYVNRADAGRNPETSIGKRPGDFLSPEQTREFMTKLRAALKTLKPQALRVVSSDGIGRARRYKVVLAPHFVAGRASCVIAAAMDVTAEPRAATKPEAVALLERITPRQRDVLSLLAQGLSMKEAARRLGIGIRTIESHREALSARLCLGGIAELTRFALDSGLA